MAPKPAAPAAPPLDLLTSITKLGEEDVPEQLRSLQFITAEPTENLLDLEDEQLREFVSQLCLPMVSTDHEVRSTALKLATKLVTVRGKLQDAFLCEDVIKANWAALHDFGAKFDAYRATLANQAEQEAAAAAEAATKKGGKGAPPVPAVDPELLLPVPHKVALDAALRYLLTAVIFRSTSVEVIAATAPPGRLLKPLVLLLEHHTLRVQLRAVELIRALMTSPDLLTPALLVDMPAALVKMLSGSGFGAIKLATTRAILAMCSFPGAHHLQLVQLGVMEAMMQLVMDPETGKCNIPTPPSAVEEAFDGEEPVAAAGSPEPERVLIDFSKPELCTASELQMDSARAVLALCALSSEAPTQLARIGGLNLLMTMLAAELKPGTAPASVEGEEPPPPPGPRAGPLDPSDEGMSAFGQTAPEGDWAACLSNSLFEAPTFKATTPELQAVFLNIVACLLALPGLQQATWEAMGKVSINERILFFFAEPPPPPLKPETPPPPVSAKGGKGASAKAGKGKPGAKEVPEAVKEKGPLEPDFPVVVKAAALDALANLANHAQLAISLAKEAEVRRLWEASATTDSRMAIGLTSLVQHMLPHLEEEPPPPPPPPPHNPLLPPPEPESPKPLGPLHHGDAARVLKDLAKGVSDNGTKVKVSIVSRATLMLLDSEVIAKARPPLPSPPPTPPPPPLATSLFVWDALGRPQMADGNAKLVQAPMTTPTA